jgi:acetyl-CoA synthetase
VVEAAAVGVPDPVKGEALWVFVVVAPGVETGDALRDELTALVTEHLGSSFKPAAVRFTTALPKTRSAKVLRRSIRSVVTGSAPGDLSGLEDPGTLDAVAHAT